MLKSLRTTTKARRRVKTESRRGAGPRFATQSSAVPRGHGPFYGPTVRCEACAATRAAGRGWHDIHTLSFSSHKTTHALRGAVGTAPQRSETEDPEPDPGHGRRVDDGTFDEGRPHAGPFLSERTNQSYTRYRKWRLRLGRRRHRLDRDSYHRIFIAARARRPCGHGKLKLCSPPSAPPSADLSSVASCALLPYVVAAATSFVRGRA